VTAEQAQEQALQQARDAAEAASVAKSRFLATMSHEIRTPLNGVLGMNELLLGTPLNQQQHQFARQIRRSGRMLLGLLNDVLDFSKVEAGALLIDESLFDPRELVAEVTEPMAEQARERAVKLHAEIDLSVPRALHGDPLRLRQILLNLISNALKFTPAGGTIRVVLGARPEPGRADWSRLICRVADTGCGMGEGTLQRLFQPFMQADSGITRKHGGTGLGLAIVKRLLEAMGGEIAVSSCPGRGSTFSFELPLRVSDAPPAVMLTAPMPLPERFKCRVLLAEDNPVNQIVATLMLEKLGCEVTLAEDGLQAMAAFKRSSFDLLLVDCHMPEMDGFELVRRLRALRRNDMPPLVACTAAALSDDRRACMDAGFDDHVLKPTSVEALAGMLSRWVLNTRGTAETS
jgi:CheY-like chemotaxis protein